jgi:hypothetical protein
MTPHNMQMLTSKENGLSAKKIHIQTISELFTSLDRLDKNGQCKVAFFFSGAAYSKHSSKVRGALEGEGACSGVEIEEHIFLFGTQLSLSKSIKRRQRGQRSCGVARGGAL